MIKTLKIKLFAMLFTAMFTFVACEQDEAIPKVQKNEKETFFTTNMAHSKYEKALLEGAKKIVPDSAIIKWLAAYGKPNYQVSELLIDENNHLMLIPLHKNADKYEGLLTLFKNEDRVAVKLFTNEDILSNKKHPLFIRYSKMQKEIGHPDFQRYLFSIPENIKTKGWIYYERVDCIAMYVTVEMEGESHSEFKGFSCTKEIMSTFVGGGGSSSSGGNSSGGNYHGGGSSTSPASSPPPAPAPEYPIEDIKKYLKCFDLGKEANLTIYVDQPITNSSFPVSLEESVGHTFVGLQQNENVAIIGFYPKGSFAKSIAGKGTLGNNQKADFDVSITTKISADKLKKVKDYIVKHSHSWYHLTAYNCTDFAIRIAKIGGLKLPDTNHSSASNPASLAEKIRKMKKSEAYTRDTKGGKAPKNKSTCN